MLPTLTINPADGSIHVSSTTLPLSKGLERVKAVAALSQHFRSDIDHGNGYEWVLFKGVSLGGIPAAFSACFHNGLLTEVHLGASLPTLKLEDGWPTRESIDEEVAFVRGALAAQLGCELTSGHARFSWGEVWSKFDAKGFLASAGISYVA